MNRICLLLPIQPFQGGVSVEEDIIYLIPKKRICQILTSQLCCLLLLIQHFQNGVSVEEDSILLMKKKEISSYFNVSEIVPSSTDTTFSKWCISRISHYWPDPKKVICSDFNVSYIFPSSTYTTVCEIV